MRATQSFGSAVAAAARRAPPGLGLVRRRRSDGALALVAGDRLVEAASGATSGSSSAAFLLSDVVTLVEQTVERRIGARCPRSSTTSGRSPCASSLKDQGTAGAATSPSTLNAMTINRYRMSFRRADGRNTPGVDVPYPFDGAVTATVTTTPAAVAIRVRPAPGQARSAAAGPGRWRRPHLHLDDRGGHVLRRGPGRERSRSDRLRSA